MSHYLEQPVNIKIINKYAWPIPKTQRVLVLRCPNGPKKTVLGLIYGPKINRFGPMWGFLSDFQAVVIYSARDIKSKCWAGLYWNWHLCIDVHVDVLVFNMVAWLLRPLQRGGGNWGPLQSEMRVSYTLWIHFLAFNIDCYLCLYWNDPLPWIYSHDSTELSVCG